MSTKTTGKEFGEKEEKRMLRFEPSPHPFLSIRLIQVRRRLADGKESTSIERVRDGIHDL